MINLSIYTTLVVAWRLKKDLITLFDPENSYVLADKGCASKDFVDAIKDKGGIPVVPAAGMLKAPIV